MNYDVVVEPFSYPEPFLRAVRRGNRIYPVLEQQPSLWPIRCQFDMDLARAPCRAPLTARKMGSGYENVVELAKARNLISDTLLYSRLAGPYIVGRINTQSWRQLHGTIDLFHFEIFTPNYSDNRL
jgi:hypothetical protein